MNRLLLPCMICVAVVLLIAPGTAALVISGVSFTPTAPLQPAGPQHMVATYSVIPSGGTTFPPGHDLEMQTGILSAKWTIQVTLDGRNAAQQTASGSVAFVNGEILSYPTNHDVGMTVTIDGTVPQAAADPFSVLQVKEIDNSGNVVPGSVSTISQPVNMPEPAGATVPVLTAPITPASPAATKAGVSPFIPVIAALGIFSLIRLWRDS